MKNLKYYLLVVALLVVYVVACTGQNPHITTADLKGAITTEAGHDYGIYYQHTPVHVYEASRVSVNKQKLRAFTGIGLSTLIHAQDTRVTNQKQNADLGGAAVAGLIMQVSKTTEEVHFFAKGTGSRVYDTEHLQTLNNYTFGMGLIYKPNYLGLGVGLNGLFRPNINQGDIGAVVVGLLEYPINDTWSFMAMGEYTPPIISRTTLSGFVGISRKF